VIAKTEVIKQITCRFTTSKMERPVNFSFHSRRDGATSCL